MSFNKVFNQNLTCVFEMYINYVDLGSATLSEFQKFEIYCGAYIRYFEIDDNVDDTWFKQVYGKKRRDL